MGYYIETPQATNKALQLVRLHGGQVVDCPRSFSVVPPDKALIVVVENGPFDAAGLAYIESEFKAFTYERDYRRKTFVLLDKKLAYELSGFAE